MSQYESEPRRFIPVVWWIPRTEKPSTSSRLSTSYQTEKPAWIHYHFQRNYEASSSSRARIFFSIIQTSVVLSLHAINSCAGARYVWRNNDFQKIKNQLKFSISISAEHSDSLSVSSVVWRCNEVDVGNVLVIAWRLKSCKSLTYCDLVNYVWTNFETSPISF